MKQKFQIILLLIIVPALTAAGFGQTADENSERWVDYAAGEYDITPNITYARANNTDLKLDLYLPRNRAQPVPTLLLFHGGGWVGGQKERNVFSYCRIFRWAGR